MLIIHPSSCCDVCLDPYSWQEETSLKEPYAIPCGHIFCKECLERTATETCPLCRKRFSREAIKKLHMDAPPENDDNSLIKRLILAWDDEVEVVNVLEEVERWLQRTESPVLLQLAKVQAEFQKFRERKADDRYRIRRLESSLKHLQRSHVFDRDMGLAVEASYSTTIEDLEATLQQSQSEVQSLRNQLARLEFSNSRRDKGKGKGKALNPTSDNDVLRRNPLPAPPMAIPMERYATLAGDIRSSSIEAEQVAAALEASLHDHRGRDGYSSDMGLSSAGAGSSRPRGSNEHIASAQNSGTSGQHYMEPPVHYAPVQTHPPPIPPMTTRPRRSSRPEALPIVLDAAVSQAQQFASRSSPSRRHRIVPGAAEDDRIYVPPTGSQTNVNEFVPLPAPPASALARAELSARKRRHRHRSKSRTRRKEEHLTPESGAKEDIAGVIGLGLIDESLEERRRVHSQAAFASGYMEGLNSGFNVRAGTTPGPPVSAPVSRSVRFDAVAESILPPATAVATTSFGGQQPSRRDTTLQAIPPEGIPPEDLASRLRDLMEDPLRPSAQAQAQQFAERRASAVSSETPTWGTVTTTNSSRRQSNSSDVMAHLRGFPEHGQLSRGSIASSQEIPVGDPRAFLPAVPASSNTNHSDRPPVDETNHYGMEGLSVPMVAASSARPEPNNYSNTHYASETPTASNSRSTTRGNAIQAIQSTSGTSSARPVNQRYTSLPNNSTSTIPGDNQTPSSRHSHRPQPLRVNSTHNANININFNHNPLPTLPNFGFPPSALASAPPRPAFPEYNSAPTLPMMPVTPATSNGTSADRRNRASNPHNSNQSNHVRTPVVDINALGLETNEGYDVYDAHRGYEPEPIPAFAAPTPRASHNLFLRSFSFDGSGNGNEADANLYR